MFIEFGNDQPKEGRKEFVDGVETTVFSSLGGDPRVSWLQVPEAATFDPETGAGIGGYTIAEAFKVVTDPKGFWVNHSYAPGPTWVSSDTPELESFLARHYHCTAGKPADLEMTHWTRSGPPGVGPGLEPGPDAVPVPAPPDEPVVDAVPAVDPVPLIDAVPEVS